MMISFRQGIVSAKSKSPWLIINGSSIDIITDIPIILTASEADTDYLIKESATTIRDAWSIPSSYDTLWLYWDIDKITGQLSRSYTALDPFAYIIPPNNPSVGQMYYDHTEYRFKSWDGQYWKDVIRVFAAKLSNNILTLQSVGSSQVNELTPCQADYIVYGIDRYPIYHYEDKWYTFYNKTTIKNFKQDQTDTFTYEKIVNSKGKNIDNLSTYRCVSWKAYNTLQYADPANTDDQPAFALILMNDSNEVSSVWFQGFLQSNSFNWTVYPNTKLYVGSQGIITTEFDTTYSCQCIGYIVNNDTIYVDFGEYYKFGTTAISPSITPSVTQSPTPSSSITASVTPTITPTPTPTISSSFSTCPNYDATVLADNPIGYWSLNTDLSDNSSSQNDLTSNTGTIGLVSDQWGHYLSYDSNNYGAIITNPITLSSDYTLEAWIKIPDSTIPGGADGNYTIFGDDGSLNIGFQIWIGDISYNNGLALQFQTNVYTKSVIPYNNSTYYYVVMTVDNNGNITFYVNGTALPLEYGSDTSNNHSYNFKFIGMNLHGNGTENQTAPFTSDEYMNGYIANPAIYGVALTQDQITNHYQAGICDYRYTGILNPPLFTPSGPSPQPH